MLTFRRSKGAQVRGGDGEHSGMLQDDDGEPRDIDRTGVEIVSPRDVRGCWS